jgi:PAS domain S-box-containing protein
MLLGEIFLPSAGHPDVLPFDGAAPFAPHHVRTKKRAPHSASQNFWLGLKPDASALVSLHPAALRISIAASDKGTDVGSKRFLPDAPAYMSDRRNDPHSSTSDERGGAAARRNSMTVMEPTEARVTPTQDMRSVALPLIGTAAFGAVVMAQCTEAAGTTGSSQNARRFERLSRAVSQLTLDPFASHTVASLAKAASMSRSSFAYCFTTVFGRPPLDFLKAERLRVAAHLLRTTSLPIKAIAGHVGYRSVSYFSRAFRSEYDIAPSAMRRPAEPAALANGKSPRDISMIAEGCPTLGTHNHAWLRLLCEATQDVIWDIDLTTGRVWWSEGMLPVFGYGPGQVGPDTKWCHDHIHPCDRTRVVEGMQRACSNGDLLWRDEFRYRKADGSYAKVSDRGVIVRNERGTAIRFMGVMQEIAAYAEAVEALA